MTSNSIRAEAHVRVESLHEAHPRIRAEDWRSPLIARLINDEDYIDGTTLMAVYYREYRGDLSEGELCLEWSGMREDYGKCVNTYQETVLTEFAALAVACILCNQRGLEITEVTRRGEKVDYWIGNREFLLEVSGTKAGDLEKLCNKKATQQLTKNPHGKPGFVCVARFTAPAARLWHYEPED